MSFQLINRWIVSAQFAGSPFFVANGAIADNNNGTGNPAVPYPAGLLADDILFLHVCSIDALGDSHTVDTPAGWTQISHQSINGAAGYFTALFYRRADGSEAGTLSVTKSVAVAGVDTFAGVMSIWRGCLATGTPYEAVANNTGQNVNMAGSAIATLGPRRTLVNFCVADDDTLSAPASLWTEQYDATSTSGTADGALKVYSIEKSATSTTAAVEHTLASSERWQVVSLALIKAGADIVDSYSFVPAGDMQSGSDFMIPSGDMDSGGDILLGRDIS